MGDNLSMTGLTRKIIAVLYFGMVAQLWSCGNACNVLLPSKGIQIPPYVIEYYQKNELERLSQDKKAIPEMWNELSCGDTLKVDVKVERIEGSGIYYYRLMYKAVNSSGNAVTLNDKSIKLVDINSNTPIEQINCWNWQQHSPSCNSAVVNPGGEITKEIRYGFSVQQQHSPTLRIVVSGDDFMEGETTVDLYAKPKKR
jgi:hypothetical protein